MSRDYVFDDINVLAKLVVTLSNRPVTPLRLQKNLYFLFAFYGATLGRLSQKEEEGTFEGTGNYPKYLFKEEIEAWQYGPVIRAVYFTYKNDYGKIENSAEWIPTDSTEKDIKDLLEYIIKQTDEMGDFSLVERTHEDIAWKDAYDKGVNIDKNKIIEEYVADAF